MIPASRFPAYFSLAPLPTHLIIKRDSAQAVLHEAIESYPATLIQSPTGYGKTVLIREYLQSHASNLQYVNIYKNTNILTFWQLIFHAIKRVNYTIGEKLERLLAKRNVNISAEDIFSVFSNIDRSIHQNLVILAIDNIQNLMVNKSENQLNHLLALQPLGLKFVFISKGITCLETEKLISKRILKRINQHHLRLNNNSMTELIIENIGGSVYKSKRNRFPDKILEKISGWPAVANLIELNDIDQSSPITSVGTNIFNFIKYEVLNNLKNDEYQFLLNICVFEDFDVPFITNILITRKEFKNKNYSATSIESYIESFVAIGILASNKQNALFTSPLVRDYLINCCKLTTELNQTYSSIQGIIIQHYIDNDNLRSALPLVLEAEDWELASCILLTHSQELIQKGDLAPLESKLTLFPQAFIKQQPYLCLLKSLLFISKFDHQNAEIYMSLADQLTSGAGFISLPLEDLKKLGFSKNTDTDTFYSTYQILNGLLQRFTIGYSHRQLQPEQDTLTNNHFECWQLYGDTVSAFINDDIAGAIKFGLKSISLAKVADDLNCLISCSGWLLHALYYNGNIEQAIDLGEGYLSLLEERNALDLANINNIYASLCFLKIEINELDKAWAYHDALTESITPYTEPREVLYGQYYLFILLLMTSNQDDKVSDAIQSFQAHQDSITQKSHLAEKEDFSILLNSELLSHLIEINKGNSFPLIQWALTYDSKPKNPSKFRVRYESFLQLIGKNISGVDILDDLNIVMESSKQSGSLARYISASMYTANILFSNGELKSCKETLGMTLRTAKKCGFVSLLIEKNNQKLLKFALKNNIEPEYSKKLLQNMQLRKTYRRIPSLPLELLAPPKSSLLDSLTHREQEVIALLAKGLKNKDLAEQLELSLVTVKAASTKYI